MRPALAHAAALGIALAALPAPSASAAPCVEVPTVSERCERWAAREEIGWAEDVLVDPTRDRVYVAATALGPGGDSNGDVYVHAYTASTGAARWSLSRDGGAGDYDAANQLTLSADGSRLCVSGGVAPGAGPVPGVPSGYDILLLCLRPDSGDVLWERTYDTPTGRDDIADGGMVEAVVPDGAGGRPVLFVGGGTGAAPLAGDPWEKDLLTLAIDPLSGDVVWQQRYDGPGRAWEVPRGIGVSADGRRVFVTGESTGDGTGHDYVTVAYDARDGTELWVARYEGLGSDLHDEPNALAVSPRGDVVAVTGASEDHPGAFRWATVVYDARTGAQRWAARHAGVPPPAPVPEEARPLFWQPVSVTGDDDEATALAFAPDGDRLYVTGYARAFPHATDVTTVAYDSADGTVRWTAGYDGPTHRHDGGEAVATGPDGRVYVTGNSGAGLLLEGRYRPGQVLDDAVTVAYDAGGAQRWVARYDGGGHTDRGSAVAVGADALYVAGMAGWLDELGRPHVDPVTLSYPLE